jgi:hypothetical protein
VESLFCGIFAFSRSVFFIMSLHIVCDSCKTDITDGNIVHFQGTVFCARCVDNCDNCGMLEDKKFMSTYIFYDHEDSYKQVYVCNDCQDDDIYARCKYIPTTLTWCECCIRDEQAHCIIEAYDTMFDAQKTVYKCISCLNDVFSEEAKKREARVLESMTS